MEGTRVPGTSNGGSFEDGTGLRAPQRQRGAAAPRDPRNGCPFCQRAAAAMASCDARCANAHHQRVPRFCRARLLMSVLYMNVAVEKVGSRSVRLFMSVLYMNVAIEKVESRSLVYGL